MTNTLTLVRSLDSPPSTTRPKLQKLQPRRERRAALKAALKSAQK